MPAGDFEQFSHQLLNMFCQWPHFSIVVDHKSIESLSFSEEFAASSHTMEQYTLYEHSMRVLQQCYEQSSYYALDDYLSFEGFSILLALHDIGKNQAVIHTGSKVNQHRYTIAMLIHALNQLDQTDLMPLLPTVINMDPLGEFLKGRQSLSDTLSIIREAARIACVDETRFFAILKFYYFCDASAYDNLKKKIFYYHPSGQMTIDPHHSRHQEFQILCQSL